MIDRSERRRAGFLVALAAALPILVLAFGHRDLWGPDEPRYGRIAHEMATDGDVVVPHLNGYAYPEKPPLLFALVAGVERIEGGPSPFRARLPSTLLASLAVLLVAVLARRWFADRTIAATAALLFATTGLVVWNESRLGLDLPLAFATLLALEGASAAVLDGSWWGALRLGLGLGMGLLFKGPHALYVPVGGLVGGWIASRGRAASSSDRPPGAGLRLTVGFAIGLALLCAWLVPALAHGGDQWTAKGERYGDRLLGQIERRLSDEAEPHQTPLLRWLGAVFLFALPWTPFVLGGIAGAFRARRREGRERYGLGAALGAVVLPLVLLSIPSSKREIYLIPLLAPCAVLAAWALHRTPEHPAVRVGRWMLLGAAALAPFAIGVGPWVVAHFEDVDPYDVVTVPGLLESRETVYVWIFLCSCVLLPAAAWALLARRDVARLAQRTAIAVVLVAVFFLAPAMEAMDPTKSFADGTKDRPSAVDVARRDAPGATFYVAGTSDVSSLWAFGYDHAELIAPGTDRVVYRRTADALSPKAPKALVLAKGKYWRERDHVRAPDPESFSILQNARILWEARIGGDVWHLLTNAP